MGQLLAGLAAAGIEDVKEDGDFLGGFGVLESGVVDTTIELAYVTVSDGGAKALNCTFKTTDGRTLRQQFWMTSGTAKGCLPYFVNQKTLEKKFLPGYTIASHICLLAAGKRIATLPTEDKVINLYSYKESKEVMTKVDMVVDLLGKQITLGVVKQLVDKTKKNDQTGAYEPTGETRAENEVDKVFRTRDGMTVAEITAKATEAKFKGQWAAKWEGQVRDKSTKSTGAAGTAGKFTPPVAAQADSLFA